MLKFTAADMNSSHDDDSECHASSFYLLMSRRRQPRFSTCHATFITYAASWL